MKMTNDDYQHFVCVVAGDNPDQIIKPYKVGKVDQYIIYPFSSAAKLHKQYIDAYQAIVDSSELSEHERELMRVELEMIQEDSDTEFFARLTEEYEHDPETGDALCSENQDGKYVYAEKGHFFSVPFKLKDGSEAYSAKKGDIDWDIMHLGSALPYQVAWETVMEHKEPENEYEENIFNNMKDKEWYFKKFGDKETYVASNTAFWGYAFVSEDTPWCELNETVSQFHWMINYYLTFIEPLSNDTILTIYECKR